MQNRLFKGLFIYKTNRFPLSERKNLLFCDAKKYHSPQNNLPRF